MPVTPDVVARLAEMTRVGLTDAEIETLTGQIDAIVEHVSRLREVDTSDLNRDGHILGLHDVSRPDTVVSSLPADEVLANAPQRHDGFFVVPAVQAE